jgi:hypothetical protein
MVLFLLSIEVLALLKMENNLVSSFFTISG